MIAVDTSVAIAAFAPWHEYHEAARAALGRRPYLPDHCALEVYATLTRLADPFRAPPGTVAEFLKRRFGGRHLRLESENLHNLPAELAALGIIGGATYDALIAVTARSNGATLRTLDRRAEPIYRALGMEYEIVIPA